MKVPISLEDCPNCVILYLISLFDKTLGLLNIQWREFLPPKAQDIFNTETPSSFYASLGNPPTLPSYVDFVHQNGKIINRDSMFNMFQYAFKTSSTALGDLTSNDALLTLFLLVIMLRQLKSFFIPKFCSVGRNLGRTTHGVDWELQNEERITKFGEYIYRLIYHSSMSIFGLLYFHDAPWWNWDSEQSGTRHIFLDHPHHEISIGMIWYYLFQAAYNLDAVLHLLELSFVISLHSPIKNGRLQNPVNIKWSEKVRGDFREMFIHHVITNLLIFGSSWFRFTRVGSMVFLVHDISDVPVDLSKLANFLKWKTGTIICFVSMVLMWIATRLYVLPFYIYRGVLKYSNLLVSENGNMDVRFYIMYRPFFYWLFAGLIALHFFWFYVFIRIAMDLVSKSELNDYSEHKNGEELSSNGLNGHTHENGKKNN
jgi:hypothetical protein